MRKARLTKKRSADELGVDELTDDLGVEIDTRPASQRAGSSRQSWPPSDEEDEAVDVDDDNDGDFAPGRRASSRATKKPKRPAGRRRTTADESSEEEAEAEEEEEEEEEEESAGAESSAEDDAGGGEEVEKAGHEVARRGSGGGGGGGGAASSSSSAVAGVRAAKPKKVLSNARLLDATSNSYEVDKILTWRWAQPEVESTTGGGGAAGPGAGAAGAAVVDALKAFSQAAESGVDTGQAVGMEVELHGGPREFYVKWAGRSYHHSAWVEEEELKGLAAIKLRYFLKIREMSAAGAVTAEEARLMAKGGDRLEEVVQPDWLKAERVLDR